MAQCLLPEPPTAGGTRIQRQHPLQSHTRIALSALIMLLAVAAGAFGAHALQSMVSPPRLETWKTAVLYHLIHGLALLILGFMERMGVLRRPGLVWATMCGGVVLFSGSLYVLVLTDTAWLGMITPLGGLVLMASWLLVAWSAMGQTDTR